MGGEAHFRFDFRTGSWKYDVAKAEGELYTPSKFHPNRPSHLREKGTAHINENGSYLNELRNIMEDN